MKRLFFFFAACATLLLMAGACHKNDPELFPDEHKSWIERPNGFSEKYTLEEMVVLSRHNIRSPLSGGGSVLSRITPHEWFEWTSSPSNLSVKGGELEQIMGGFFLEWVRDEKLLTGNETPGESLRFYSNAKQRTIKTTEYFLAGMYPEAGFTIETHAEYDTMDPVFTPQTTGVDEDFRAKALKEIAKFGGADGFAGIGRKMDANFTLLEKVLDITKSPASANDTTSINRDDVEITIKENAEPSMKGGLKMACSAADALVLQYYEDTDDISAGFGHRLSFSDWEAISAIKDWYEDVLFTAPFVARNISAPLLSVINSELTTPGRKFTFLCGHDSNLCSVLAALDCEEYTLSDAIEKKTPIGGKLIFEKWKDKDGKEYVDVILVYASAFQLRTKASLSLSNPPSYAPIEFRGLTPNDDGLYSLKDLSYHIASAIE